MTARSKIFSAASHACSEADPSLRGEAPGTAATRASGSDVQRRTPRASRECLVDAGRQFGRDGASRLLSLSEKVAGVLAVELVELPLCLSRSERCRGHAMAEIGDVRVGGLELAPCAVYGSLVLDCVGRR